MIRKGTSDELTGIQKQLLTDYLEIQMSKLHEEDWMGWMLQDISEKMNNSEVSKKSKESYKEILKIKDDKGQIKVKSQLDISLLNTLLQFTYSNECKPEEADENGTAFKNYIRNIVGNRNDIAHEPVKDEKFLHRIAMEVYTRLDEFIEYLELLGWANGDDKEKEYVNKYKSILEEFYNENLLTGVEKGGAKTKFASEEETEKISIEEEAIYQPEVNAEAGSILESNDNGLTRQSNSNQTIIKPAEAGKADAISAKITKGNVYRAIEVESPKRQMHRELGSEVPITESLAEQKTPEPVKVPDPIAPAITSEKKVHNGTEIVGFKRRYHGNLNQEAPLTGDDTKFPWKDVAPMLGALAAEEAERAKNYEISVLNPPSRKSYDKGFTRESNNIQTIIKAAESGNADAMYQLGCCYYKGKGTEQDVKEAVKWFKAAAEAGKAEAMNILGCCYYEGKGTEQDLKEAFKWFNAAAEAGDSQAMGNLGNFYLNGWGTEKNLDEAFKWCKTAVDAGNEHAMCGLGVCYLNGLGTEKDPNEAFKLFKMAAESRDAEAMLKLGACYFNGLGTEKDSNEAFKWIKAAAEAGDTDAKDILGSITQKEEGVEED